MPMLDCGLTLEEIALKDVPYGLPFIYADSENIPSTNEELDAYKADFSIPEGYGIGPENWVKN